MGGGGYDQQISDITLACRFSAPPYPLSLTPFPLLPVSLFPLLRPTSSPLHRRPPSNLSQGCATNCPPSASNSTLPASPPPFTKPSASPPRTPSPTPPSPAPSPPPSSPKFDSPQALRQQAPPPPGAPPRNPPPDLRPIQHPLPPPSPWSTTIFHPPSPPNTPPATPKNAPCAPTAPARPRTPPHSTAPAALFQAGARPWSLGTIRAPPPSLTTLAGKTVRRPGRVLRVDETTNEDTAEPLMGTNERVHSCVRVRLACGGLGLDDNAVWGV